MTKACPQCAFANPTGFKFCGQCGAALAPVASPGDAPARPLPPQALKGKDEAERRQLTVVFCDLVGSTALSDRLDPEELRDVVRQYQEAAGAVIDRFDGYVAQYLGDGLLVYFGFPHAHEDAPRRAVHAGLGIVDAIGLLSARLQRDRSVQLGVRIGIHTGEVVAGEIGSGTTQEKLALGQTPNVAARVQAAASENTVVVSDSDLSPRPALLYVGSTWRPRAQRHRASARTPSNPG